MILIHNLKFQCHKNTSTDTQTRTQIQHLPHLFTIYDTGNAVIVHIIALDSILIQGSMCQAFRISEVNKMNTRKPRRVYG